MGKILQTRILIAFFKGKVLNFKYILIKIYSLGSNWHYTSIGSDSGLAPNRWQAIIWSNDDPFLWRIYASLRVLLHGMVLCIEVQCSLHPMPFPQPQTPYATLCSGRHLNVTQAHGTSQKCLSRLVPSLQSNKRNQERFFGCRMYKSWVQFILLENYP